MSGNGKKKLIYGIIGFGCGIALSGIMILIMVLNTNEYQQGLISYISKSEVQKSDIEQSNITEPSSSEKSAVSEEQPIEEGVIENNDTDKEDTQDRLVTEENQKEPDTINVFIPENSTSTKICEILQEKGIILDAQDFEDYIKLNKKTKYLKSGEILVPTKASYDELLKSLVTK